MSCLDDSDGIVARDGDDYFAVIPHDYLAGGRASQGTVGNAHTQPIDAVDLLSHGTTWMAANLV